MSRWPETSSASRWKPPQHFPNATLVSVHHEGWAHLRESQEQLADVFAQFNLADRLTGFDKGKPLEVAV